MKNKLIPIVLLCTAIMFNTATINKTRKQTETQLIEMKQTIDSLSCVIDEQHTYILELDKAISEK